MSIEKCQNCAYLNPVMYHCDKYLRGCETAVYLCSREQPQTNANRIRAMTVTEMVEFMAKHNACLRPKRTDGECEEYYDCKYCWLDWLKEEAT